MKYTKKLMLLTLAAFLFSACGGSVDDGDTPPVVDTTPPIFEQGYPPEGSPIIGACFVTAEFNDPLLASTITEETFIIQDISSSTPFTSADGTWQLSPYTDTIALFVPLTPNTPIPDGTYTVTLTTAITNAAGINLATEQSWNFTTTDAASVVCPPF